MKSAPKLVAVIGPTGSGKTALGEQLALHFNGEIISADSKQVYRGMDIGTAKEKVLKVPQQLIDIKDPGEKITVAEFQQHAYQAIEATLARGKQPFLVGASMLYAESVLNGYIFKEGQKSQEQQPRFQVLKIGIKLPKEELVKRLEQRTEKWLEEGLLKEIQTLLQNGVSPEWLYRCGQEYRYFMQYLQGDLSLEEAIKKTNTSLRQYAKRQYTWWRRHSDVNWVEGYPEAEKLVQRFL